MLWYINYMGSAFRKIFIFFVLAIIAWAGFALGNHYGQGQCEICPPTEIDFSLFWEAYQKLQEHFADSEKISTPAIIYGAISGMTESLNDSYTIFLTPEDAKIFKEDVQGVLEGVGMEIGIKEKQLTVIAPLEGTPADFAGLLPGDKILEIDGISTQGISVDKAIKLIRGEKGTQVSLTIFREGWDKSREFEIVRAAIEIPSLKWELIGEEKDIAHIKLYQFSQKASFDFKEAALEILAGPVEKIILDLRSNPGGYLHVAKDIANWFLEEGDIVLIEEFGVEGTREEYKASENGKLLAYPVLVLINQGTASGAEILAGALRDNRGIKLIGENSFGKGSVQELIDLSDGSKLKITVANWLTPNGVLISEQGLEPDIKVEMTEEDYKQERDLQLNKAIEVMDKIR